MIHLQNDIPNNKDLTSDRIFGSEHFSVRAFADEFVDGEPAVRTGHRVQAEPLAKLVIVHCNGVR